MRTVPVTLRVCPGCGCVLAALFFPVPTKRNAFNSELLPTLGMPTTRRRTPVSGVDVYRAAPDKWECRIELEACRTPAFAAALLSSFARAHTQSYTRCTSFFLRVSTNIT